MQRKPLLCLFLLAAAGVGHGARQPDGSAPQPKAPPGWKYVTAKDGTYRFLFPAETKASRRRESEREGDTLSGRTEINACVLKDGTALAVVAARVDGRRVGWHVRALAGWQPGHLRRVLGGAGHQQVLLGAEPLTRQAEA
jgi:hypothetical protein